MAHIVVIDDEAEICDLLKTMLEEKGHTVHTSINAQNLTEILNPPPDIILLDVLMPDINGLECMPQIQSLTPKARVIVITGLDDYHLADAFYEAGACGFLNKPLHHNQILSSIQHALSQDASASSSECGDHSLSCT